MDKRSKISKANERKRKVKRGKDEKVNGQWGKERCPRPHTRERYNVVDVLHAIVHLLAR